ncbi:MAG: hypothetical protein ACM3MH_02240, partial [Actinomycetota bacterium]
QRSVDHFQPVGITKAVDSNHSIAQLHRRRSPRNLVIQRKDRNSGAICLSFHRRAGSGDN